ncbi:MAG: serine hydrolase [Caulobacteraceae bacterium]
MIKRVAVACLAVLGLSLGAATAPPTAVAPVTPSAHPAPGPAPAATPAAAPTPDLTAQDAETFFDGLFPYAIQRGDIAGGVIVVVKDGQILFAKGYGYSDMAKRTPVIADKTLFRPGSVSKLFTWTSVMQLVGEGKIDLDRDVNDYLDFKIPPKYGKPITMRELMTHTAGFEDGISGAFVKKPSQLIPLRTYLMRHMPTRIYPPGKIVAYSNYGASLAGYIVQRLSGEPYAQYVANHIFTPLGMSHSTMVQPLPANLAPDMSKGYIVATAAKPYPFELIETAPAGALSSTGVDMAHFMIAQLQNGTYNGAQILKPETAELMHSPQSFMAPGVNGFDLGFYQENRNGLRIIGHAGDTDPFHSDLHLLLDKNVGIFMSVNSLGTAGEAEKVRVGLFRAFLDRYYPYSAPVEATVANPKADAAKVAGWYEGSRKIDTALRLVFALGQASVTAHPDGTISVSLLKGLNGVPKVWREVGPLTYREVGGQTHLKFVTNASGAIQYWISDDFIPVEVFMPVHGLKQSPCFNALTIAFVAVLALTLAIWIGGAITRRRFGARLEFPPTQARLRLASRIGVIILLATVAGWIGLFALISSGNGALNNWMLALYCLGVLAIISALVVLAEAIMRVVRGPGRWLARSGEFVLGLAALWGLWLIFAYGLANFSLNY